MNFKNKSINRSKFNGSQILNQISGQIEREFRIFLIFILIEVIYELIEISKSVTFDCDLIVKWENVNTFAKIHIKFLIIN
jgi:hypothetical protein